MFKYFFPQAWPPPPEAGLALPIYGCGGQLQVRFLFFIPLESESCVPLQCIVTKWVTHAETWLMWLWLVVESQCLLLLFLLLVRKGLTMHRLVKADNLIASYSAFHNLEVFGNNLFWLVHIWDNTLAKSFNFRMKYASGDVLSSYF